MGFKGVNEKKFLGENAAIAPLKLSDKRSSIKSVSNMQ